MLTLFRLSRNVSSSRLILLNGHAGELVDAGPEKTPSPVAKDSGASKTFDLLLDVALPIVVSFGRTSLQIREVLKLNTGSIELDRFVTDPVEVIVNECVIARGEVVVVDGNYGVRINQLASREDRLRTGIAETTHKGGRV
jgi:flagellar motor switch protein FliN